MSEVRRAIATAKRDRFWSIYDNVPQDHQTGGCEWCELGWVEGPGLVYRCENCNHGQEPYMISTEPPQEPRKGLWERIRGWWPQ